MAVVMQSACALCPLQTLPRPLVSNMIQAPSSFKQNPHDTFIIASCLIRDPFQRWRNNTPGRVFASAARVEMQMCTQMHRNTATDTHIISVSLLAGWLIDCGCSDTLCRIGILPLIGADTNSSRTAGDRGGTEAALANDLDGRHLQMWEKPHWCHAAFSLGHVYIIYGPFQRWQSADVWHMRCKSHVTIALKERIGLQITVSDELNNAHLKQSWSSGVQHAAEPCCWVFGRPFPITQASSLVVRETLYKKHLLQSSGKLQQVKSLYTSRVLHSLQHFVTKMYSMCNTKWYSEVFSWVNLYPID